jgi:hypothetical protein
VCLNGRCSFYNYCRADGDICEKNSDCCNGGCDPATKRCDRLTQCVTTNSPCNGVRSCCDTLCVATNYGSSYCYPMCGCKPYDDVCTSDGICCSGSCGTADADGVRRCVRAQSCLPDGDVCGGLGASQNCCNGGKASCLPTGSGVSRCFPNNGACYPAGHSCSLCDSCCSNICVPDSTGALKCAASCIPLNTGTCTSDSDCCSGGACQSGTCVPSGLTCTPIGGKCTLDSDCCSGPCVGGFCRAPT